MIRGRPERDHHGNASSRAHVRDLGRTAFVPGEVSLVKANEDYQQAEAGLGELMNEWERAETSGNSKRQDVP